MTKEERPNRVLRRRPSRPQVILDDESARRHELDGVGRFGEVATVEEDEPERPERRQNVAPVADEELHDAKAAQALGRDRRPFRIVLDRYDRGGRRGHRGRCFAECRPDLRAAATGREDCEQSLDLGQRRPAARHSSASGNER